MHNEDVVAHLHRLEVHRVRIWSYEWLFWPSYIISKLGFLILWTIDTVSLRSLADYNNRMKDVQYWNSRYPRPWRSPWSSDIKFHSIVRAKASIQCLNVYTFEKYYWNGAKSNMFLEFHIFEYSFLFLYLKKYNTFMATRIVVSI